ncbi:MAG: efflux RND transporter periplasmic adaptor subunit [Chloroflexaceae bacterium]|nr:efflux RND transporter periplasmic adaptor subunit [Chloroflexaceae bacterium]
MRPDPRRIIPLVVVITLIGGGGWWGYTAWFAPQRSTISATGTIEATEYTVSAELAGRITTMLVDEGDPVEAGQTLVTLDSSLLVTQRDQAVASYQAAQQSALAAEANAQLERRSASITSERLRAIEAQAEASRAQAQAALASVRSLELQMSKMNLTSPIDGVVIERTAEPGEMALPGGTLLVLADLRSLQITVYVPEDRYGGIMIGDRAALEVDSWPGETFVARVKRIADEAEFTPRNVQTAEGRKVLVFAITLEVEHTDGRLKPGMPADVRFE